MLHLPSHPDTHHLNCSIFKLKCTKQTTSVSAAVSVYLYLCHGLFICLSCDVCLCLLILNHYLFVFKPAKRTKNKRTAHNNNNNNTHKNNKNNHNNNYNRNTVESYLVVDIKCGANIAVHCQGLCPKMITFLLHHFRYEIRIKHDFVCIRFENQV